ncbi:carbohydrate-binding module family 48 protein [Thermothelomyces thermophilus ATCC 42464]|uniref:Carbohydrate-binding module family 48 protein n=1 Tax=Thermothelomyces thermophilus (strain ATCC 42464 / BCRC 31852 / DSM 1799) TaxID=573729 RepID=G2QFL8_THET4|nr:carbohydrate-binding module family 48 protein [Thermothelomyces thermophilus ATCC 42464]AEO59235.1 carbohydrate-binding module family 48 protein [Thermothelomyces thermophilus ATCC 42464]
MRSYTFKWPHDAEEVYVTGTFDDWTKSERLERVGQVFQKTVTFPDSVDKVLYKFVVDGSWTTDHTAPQEKDQEGNDNNVLLAEQMDKLEEASQAAAINNLVPEFTTAQLAGTVPLETNKEGEKQKDEKDEGQVATSGAAILSSAAPESTTAQLAAEVPREEKKEKDIPPGGFPETPATELEKEVKVEPLPAAEGAINPIKLEPGEEVPKDITAGAAVDSHVTLDKDSYEKSDRIPGIETTLPSVSGNIIPESSLPVAAPDVATISTVTPESTTAKLAGDVPLEPKVPEVVKKSQEEAKVEPEASANSEEVKEKAAVEEELLNKVAEAPSTSEGTAGKGTEKAETDKTAPENVVAAATTASEVALGAAITAAGAAIPLASDAAAKASDVAADVASKAAAAPGAAQAQEEEKQKTAIDSVSPEVPTEVKESLREAGESPEAAVNTAAVVEKKEYEAELLEKVEPAKAVDESSTKVAEGEDVASTEGAKAIIAQAEAEESLPKPIEEPASAEAPQAETEPKPAEEATALAVEPPQPTEAVKTVDEAKSTETPKPAEEEKPSDIKLAEGIAPAVTATAVEPPKPAEAVKAVDVAEPAEATKAADEPKAAEPAVTTEPAKTADEPKPVETPAATEGPAAVEAAEPAAEHAAATEPAAPTTEAAATTKVDDAKPVTNGSTTDTPASKATDGATDKATSDKKKKHRISGFFSKLKSKFA